MPSKAHILQHLQREILPLQGFKTAMNSRDTLPLGPISQAFPQHKFPLGATHEFILSQPEHLASTYGFLMALLSKMMETEGATLWISPCRNLFPPALVRFGIHPDKIIFLDLKKENDCLWAAEEALKCEGLTAVVCETQNLSFTASRRFQLAVEKSGVTGFMLRNASGKLLTTACVTRWRIRPLPSPLETGMPGIGFPRWHVELLKVRNGQPASWQIEFSEKQFHQIPATTVHHQEERRKTG